MIDCLKNNCSDNGECKTINGNDVCVCKEGFTGTNCSEVLENTPQVNQMISHQQYSSYELYGNQNPLFYQNEVSLIYIFINQSSYQALLDPVNKNDDTYCKKQKN